MREPLRPTGASCKETEYMESDLRFLAWAVYLTRLRRQARIWRVSCRWLKSVHFAAPVLQRLEPKLCAWWLEREDMAFEAMEKPSAKEEGEKVPGVH